MVNLWTGYIIFSKAPREIRGDYSEDIFDEDFVGGEDINDEIPDGADLGGTDRAGDEFENPVVSGRRRHTCLSYNLTGHPERAICTPGSQYIIRCRVCICPYMGNINHFCRPMPPEQYCEQAFPNFNYIPMGRRAAGENGTELNVTKIQYPIQVKIPHNHTMYRCEKPGNLTDECFICECEPDSILVEEHCYKSDSDACTDAFPTFIKAGDHPIAFKKYIPKLK